MKQCVFFWFLFFKCLFEGRKGWNNFISKFSATKHAMNFYSKKIKRSQLYIAMAILLNEENGVTQHRTSFTNGLRPLQISVHLLQGLQLPETVLFKRKNLFMAKLLLTLILLYFSKFCDFILVTQLQTVVVKVTYFPRQTKLHFII